MYVFLIKCRGFNLPILKIRDFHCICIAPVGSAKEYLFYHGLNSTISTVLHTDHLILMQILNPYGNIGTMGLRSSSTSQSFPSILKYIQQFSETAKVVYIYISQIEYIMYIYIHTYIHIYVYIYIYIHVQH